MKIDHSNEVDFFFEKFTSESRSFKGTKKYIYHFDVSPKGFLFANITKSVRNKEVMANIK